MKPLRSLLPYLLMALFGVVTAVVVTTCWG